jgi:hypothetical protein
VKEELSKTTRAHNSSKMLLEKGLLNSNINKTLLAKGLLKCNTSRTFNTPMTWLASGSPNNISKCLLSFRQVTRLETFRKNLAKVRRAVDQECPEISALSVVINKAGTFCVRGGIGFGAGFYSSEAVER